MSDENSSRRSVSRRQALLGIGAAGAALGVGGVGTFAQFTDTEGQSSTFTAGAIDGTIVTNASYNGTALTGDAASDIVSVDGESAGASLHFEDVKPGDYGSFNFTLEVTNNPAWVGACLGIGSNTDGTVVEPEVEAENKIGTGTVPTAGFGSQASTEGELAENTYIIPFYDNDSTSQFFDSSGAPSSFGSTGVSAPSGFWSNSQDAGFSAQVQGQNYLAPRPLASVVDQKFESTKTFNANQTTDFQTINSPSDTSIENGCILLNGTGSSNDSNNTQTAAPLPPATPLNFGFDWHIPYEVGNEAQGDEMVVDAGFTFSQVRSSAGPTLQNTYDPTNN